MARARAAIAVCLHHNLGKKEFSMKIDLYTKAVLTMIAVALVAIAGQGLLVRATAQTAASGPTVPTLQCGTGALPCYVQNTPSSALYTRTVTDKDLEQEKQGKK
jgi:hypothetical protein